MKGLHGSDKYGVCKSTPAGLNGHLRPIGRTKVRLTPLPRYTPVLAYIGATRKWCRAGCYYGRAFGRIAKLAILPSE